MDSLFLFQFACFIFMLVNAFFVALSYICMYDGRTSGMSVHDG